MKETRLGEFEEAVRLLVGILGDEEAYTLKISDEFKLQTAASIGAVHSTLSRSEDKGFLTSEMKRQRLKEEENGFIPLRYTNREF
ncbi:MAG: hypothetical protein MI975_05945 [Cytophagales bacterium]|nr:hypothetical protein [Cytophagales bacterium]